MFPYATISRWNIAKTRIFSFSECAAVRQVPSIFGNGRYQPFVAIDNVYPNHLDGDGPRRFYSQIIGEKTDRLNQFKILLNWDRDVSEDLNTSSKLDIIGDLMLQGIEPRAKATNKNAYIRSQPELWIAPIWNSIFVDLSILLGECAISEYEHLNPKWVCPVDRDEPQGYLDYPAITFDVKTAPADDPLLNALLKEYQYNNRRNLKDGAWIEIYDRILLENGFDPDDFDYREYSPDRVSRLLTPSNNQPHFYPFEAAWAFLIIGFQRKYVPDMLDDYYAHSQIALGDCLRQETLPNWSTFPELPNRKAQ